MAEQKRRRKGPHDGEATREALMDAAERLFAEQGVDGVSVRAVNTAAGLAPAAVHYHFGSKEALLDAVLIRRGRAVIADISQRCDRLLELQGRPDPRDIIRALVAPYAELLEADSVGGMRWLSIIGQLALNGGERMMSSAAPATERLQTLIRRAFPEASESVLETAWTLAVEALLLLMARAPETWIDAGATAAAAGEILIDFVVGGLTHALDQAQLPAERPVPAVVA